jgi:phosphoribosylglycinamide formyltransferase-1
VTAEPVGIPLRVGVLGLGNGSTAAALIESAERGELSAEIAVVAAKTGCGALAVARAHAIPAVDLGASADDGDRDEERHAAILETFERAKVDLIVLAGEPSELGPPARERFAGRILSAHPVLPASMGRRQDHGDRLYAAILESGARVCGASVHLVAVGEHDGPVLWRSEVEVRSGDSADSLRARVRAAERFSLVEYLRFAVRSWTGSGALPRDPELDEDSGDS